MKKPLVVSLWLFLTIFSLTGCATSQSIVLSPADSTLPRDNFKIGSFTNETSELSLSDYETYYRLELQSALKKKNINTVLEDSGEIVLNTRIVDYQAGNAFKRWLMPGWGKTVCAIQVDILDAAGKKKGAVGIRRSIGFGGAYTIGAYKTVFKDVAEAVAKQLDTKAVPKPAV